MVTSIKTTYVMNSAKIVVFKPSGCSVMFAFAANADRDQPACTFLQSDPDMHCLLFISLIRFCSSVCCLFNNNTKF